MTIEFRPEKGTGALSPALAQSPPPTPRVANSVSKDLLEALANKVKVPDVDDEPLPEETELPPDTGSLGRHTPAPMAANALKGMADALQHPTQMASQDGLVNRQTTSGAGNQAASRLVREARQAKADLETMKSLGSADGIPLSQKVTTGDERAKVVLELSGYSVSASGAVSNADGQILSPRQVDELGLHLLQEAAADYQRQKTAYQAKRSQLEGHLDNFSRTSLNMLEASLWRLEAQTRPKTVREAVIDTITRTVASGMDPRAIDLSWLDQARTVGIETTTLTGDQLAFIKRLETAGNFVRRKNGRIVIVGLSDTDLEDIRGVQQLLASPNSDAARELRDAFVKLARAWALADAMAAIYGKQLQDVLASRETGVEGRPPESPPADEPADAGREQTLGAWPDTPRTDGATGATQRHVGLIPTAAASDQSGEAQLGRLSRQRDEAERQDHQRTDDQRQAALDQQTARRLAAEAAAIEKRAVRAAKDQRHP